MSNAPTARKTIMPSLDAHARMPADWKPPAPGWSAAFATPSKLVVIAYVAAQLRTGTVHEHLRSMGRFFATADGPANLEAAEFVDRTGCKTILSLGYWTSPVRYEAWEMNSGFHEWWRDPMRTNEPNGYFRTVLTVPVDRIETIFSSQEPVGAAKSGQTIRGPVRDHNYWGSMRHRLPVSARNDLSSPYGDELPHLGTTATAGKRIRVTAPENLVVIRSGQDWSRCSDAELAIYEDSVRPALVKGMDYLRDHPEETGCCDMHLAREIAADGSGLGQSFGFGFFLSLSHLERWAATHPTHLAIFARFVELVRSQKFKFDLRLWHEVSVLPGAGQIFEYINCHCTTGLLPYFTAEEF